MTAVLTKNFSFRTGLAQENCVVEPTISSSLCPKPSVLQTETAPLGSAVESSVLVPATFHCTSQNKINLLFEQNQENVIISEQIGHKKTANAPSTSHTTYSVFTEVDKDNKNEPQTVSITNENTIHEPLLTIYDSLPPQPLVINDPLDPATYAGKRLIEKDIISAVLLEDYSIEKDYVFPTVNQRKFSMTWRSCRLPDGTLQERKWLVYSKKNDAAYCLHCLLFALPNQNTIWSTTGYRGWQTGNTHRDIESHETSKIHLSCQAGKVQWLCQRHIDKQMTVGKNKVIEHNREVLSVIIDCCRYLTEEMMAFRKSSFLTGKLTNLFKTLSKYSPDARVYFEKIELYRKQEKTLPSNFLSYRNIFDLISVMSKLVKEEMVKSIKLNNRYSIIVDSTQDVSNKEATSLLLRYVEDSEHGGKPVERLFKVFTTGDTTGSNMKDLIFNSLKEDGLDPAMIIGQSMDGAGNMRGKCKGLSTRVTEENKKALYVWCSSHRFALVVNKSVDICPEIRNLFSLLEEIYVFMSGYKRQHKFAENLQKTMTSKNRKLRLKRVQTTRWSSRNEALKTILKCYSELKATLEGLAADKTSDNETVTMAKGLCKKLSDYDIILCMHIVERVYGVLNPVTVLLQGVSVDYGIVQGFVERVKTDIMALRMDNAWEEILSKAERFCHEHDIVQIQTSNLRGVKRKRTKFMDEMGVDEPIVDAKRRLKVEVYYKVIDSLHSQLEDRFSDHSLTMVKQMACFSHNGVIKLQAGGKITRSNDVNIKELCQYYALDSDLVSEELNDFSELYTSLHKNISIHDLLLVVKNATLENENADEESKECDDANEDHEADEENNTQESGQGKEISWINQGFVKPYRCLTQFSGFPNLNIMYKTLLSLPVTSCSAERSMSKLKIIKNRLRSSMGDSWLSNMMILSSEKDILDKINNSDIIDVFGNTTTARKRLLCNL